MNYDVKIMNTASYYLTRLTCLTCLTVFLSGCANNAQPETAVSPGKQQLMSINKYLTEKDKDVIEHFIARKGWRMQPSPDGYYYEIFDPGASPAAVRGDVVAYDYTISLLDGTVCYTSANGEPKTFVVGGSEEISGMHYAVKALGKGGKARFIFPPQAAYGLQGDLDKIPPRAVLLYNVQIIELKRAK